MAKEFIYSIIFDRKWFNLNLTDTDLQLFENYLLENPNSGNLIQGTGGLRKIIWALPNRGKSGSVRILYIDFISYEKIYIVDIFTKDQKENLSMSEKNIIKKVVKAIGEELKHEWTI